MLPPMYDLDTDKQKNLATGQSGITPPTFNMPQVFASFLRGWALFPTVLKSLTSLLAIFFQPQLSWHEDHAVPGLEVQPPCSGVGEVFLLVSQKILMTDASLLGWKESWTPCWCRKNGCWRNLFPWSTFWNFGRFGCPAVLDIPNGVSPNQRLIGQCHTSRVQQTLRSNKKPHWDKRVRKMSVLGRTSCPSQPCTPLTSQVWTTGRQTNPASSK